MVVQKLFKQLDYCFIRPSPEKQFKKATGSTNEFGWTSQAGIKLKKLLLFQYFIFTQFLLYSRKLNVFFFS